MRYFNFTLVSYKMIREREGGRERVNNHHQNRKVGGAARFSFQICRYKIEMIMSHESLLFLKKLLRHN